MKATRSKAFETTPRTGITVTGIMLYFDPVVVVLSAIFS